MAEISFTAMVPAGQNTYHEHYTQKVNYIHLLYIFNIHKFKISGTNVHKKKPIGIYKIRTRINNEFLTFI